ncbi:MAG: hypothetical protein K8Q89_10195 [Nitrosarchaeum sp.]|nr:hypothetical protein [Nitrosarchaeum sp.]
MQFKIKAWIIYLLGLLVVLGLGFFTDVISSPLVGYYLLYGTIALGAYYLTHRLWFGKQKKS